MLFSKIVDFVDGKLSNDKINNTTMNDVEEVPSYGPTRSIFFLSIVSQFILFEGMGREPLMY